MLRSHALDMFLCNHTYKKACQKQSFQVYLYFNVCNGPWLFDEDDSREELECRDGHLALDCGGP